MISPKSRAHKEKKEKGQPRKKHKNKAFYNSKAWRETREAYLRHYRNQLFNTLPNGKWKYMDVDAHQVSYLLSFITPKRLPCEICLKLYINEAYDSVEEGKELDHIQPVNPENALEVDKEWPHDGGTISYGDPFEFNNLQLLCKRHHAKKSQRER